MNNIIIFKYKVRIIIRMIGGKINLDIKKRGKMMKVAVVMGSKSDYPKVQEGIELLEKYGVSVVVRVLSAHRTPVQLTEFLNEIEDEEILSAIRWHTAGKAAHLPGVIASQTLIPVIGLPIKSSTMDGLDSLLSIVQMPKGIPVATVAIDGGLNAALLALQIMSLKYPKIKDDLVLYREEMEQKVLEDDKNLRG